MWGISHHVSILLEAEGRLNSQLLEAEFARKFNNEFQESFTDNNETKGFHRFINSSTIFSSGGDQSHSPVAEPLAPHLEIKAHAFDASFLALGGMTKTPQNLGAGQHEIKNTGNGILTRSGDIQDLPSPCLIGKFALGCETRDCLIWTPNRHVKIASFNVNSR